MNNELGKRIADIVCQAWNELDASLFESILSDDFEYISVWVLETMKGKDRYMEYISGKFESIGKGNNPVSAELIYQEPIDKYVGVIEPRRQFGCSRTDYSRQQAKEFVDATC